MHNRISLAESLCTVYNVCDFCKCVSDELGLPLLHSTSGRPVCPGRQRQTKNACSRMHSAFLPHPSVLQSTTCLSSTVPEAPTHVNRNFSSQPALTLYSRIPSWRLSRTETLRPIPMNDPTLCSSTAQLLLTQIDQLRLTNAPSVRISDASRRARALVLAVDVSAFSVSSARILQTLFVAAFLTFNQGITNKTGRTSTVGLSLDHPTLRVHPASSIFQTRVLASPFRATAFVGFAIRIQSAFVRFALNLGVALVAVGAQTHLPSVGGLTHGVLAATMWIFTHVLTLFVSAHFGGGAVVVGATPREASASGAQLTSRARYLG